jgi:serine/threonine protein kinase/tetratricopeptide (TPR) repeat protein
MICPHCGKEATAIRGHCSSCHGELGPDGAAEAQTTFEPIVFGDSGGSGDVTIAGQGDLTIDVTPSRPAVPPTVLLKTPPPASGSPHDSGGLPDATLPTGTAGGSSRSMRAVAAGPLVPGEAFGERYHVIRLLGAGGMGAVYQAWDEELGVAVAIKVIKPEVLADPEAGEELERRFKRELLLARQVTHKNVVRIHDLGEIDGIKYITMPYVQGSDLAGMIRKHGKLSVERVVALGRQIASGLAAAHEAGVVHRDLKPENIMVEGDVALIMDFGIARALSATEKTVAGAVRGTIGYMAPEQARGEPVDQRVDIYAFGLILYDMLLGRVRHARSGQNPVAELMERMQHAPPPPIELDPNIPADLDRVVSRCIEPDKNLRYQTTGELVEVFNQLDTEGHLIAGSTTTVRPSAVSIPVPAPPPPVVSRTPSIRTVVAIAAVVMLAVAGAWFGPSLLRNRGTSTVSTPTTQGAPTLAILPFRNASGDQSLDWLGPALAEILRSEVGQDAMLRTISSDRLQQLLTDLRISADTNLNPATLRRLAEFSNAQAVLWGQYLSFGNEIRIDATIEDLQGQRAIPLKAQAPTQAALVGALGELAVSVRRSLIQSETAADLSASSAKPSSRSLMALRYYNEGVSLARQGKHSEALKSFEASTKEDADFALAYSKLGEAYKSQGYDSEAEQFSRKAAAMSEGLPAREKYMILAGHARVLGDNAKAIESFENLLKAAPEDTDVRYELARIQEETGALDQARENFLRVLKDDPKYLDALLAAGRVEIRRREPQAALEHLNQALTLAIQFDNVEARGTILNATGIAYKRLNKTDEALRYYTEALEIRRKLGQKGGIAATLTEIAQVNVMMGQAADALKNYNEALELRREIGDRRGTANTLAELGSFHVNRSEYAQALNLYRESLQIHRDTGNRSNEALLLNNIGGVYFNQANYEDALTYFERALTLREQLKVPSDIAQTVHNLAEVNVKMGQYDRALEQYLRALDLNRSTGNKRGAAIGSYSVGTLFEFQGRFGASLTSKEEALKTFRELGDSGFWLVEMLSGHGDALSEVGRFDEARNVLNDALTRARELKNQVLVGQTLNYLGDTFYHAGDLAAARPLFEQALQTATGAKERHLVLLTQVNLAKLDARERPAAAVTALTRLVKETDQENLRYLSTLASIQLGEALGQLKRYGPAAQELTRAIARSEPLGLRALLASAHSRLGGVLAADGKSAEAEQHRSQAARLVNEIYKEAGTETIRKRTDLTQAVNSATR